MPKAKISGQDKLVIPIVGSTYTDDDSGRRVVDGQVHQLDDPGDRSLTVTEVALGDPQGREVRGVLSHPGTQEDGREYACDINVFNAVWVTAKEETTTKEDQ